jgi:hypothetical protein
VSLEQKPKKLHFNQDTLVADIYGESIFSIFGLINSKRANQVLNYAIHELLNDSDFKSPEERAVFFRQISEVILRPVPESKVKNNYVQKNLCKFEKEDFVHDRNIVQLCLNYLNNINH